MQRTDIHKGNTKKRSTQHDLDSMILPKDGFKLLLTLALEGFIMENGFNPSQIAEFAMNTMSSTETVIVNFNSADDIYESTSDEDALVKKTIFANNKENTYLNGLSFIANPNNLGKKVPVRSLVNGMKNIDLSKDGNVAADVESNRELRASF